MVFGALGDGVLWESVLGVFLSFFLLLCLLLELAAGAGVCASSAVAASGFCGWGGGAFVALRFFLCGVEEDEEEDALGPDAFGALGLDLDFFGCLLARGVDLSLTGDRRGGAIVLSAAG